MLPRTKFLQSVHAILELLELYVHEPLVTVVYSKLIITSIRQFLPQ